MTATGPIQIVTLATVHAELQEIKEFMYRAQGDYRRIEALETETSKQAEKINSLTARVSALWVTHSITVVLLGGILLDVFKK